MYLKTLPVIEFNKSSNNIKSIRCMKGLDKEFGVKSYSIEYDARKEKSIPLSIINYEYIKGYAMVHGIKCLEVVGTAGLWDGEKPHEITEFICIENGYIKTIAAFEECDGVNMLLTFKDEEFIKHWSVGENNQGFAIDINERKIISNEDKNKFYVDNEISGTYDLVGCFDITINSATYHTIRMIYIGDSGQISEFYYDNSGNEILRRYFVPDTWGYDDKIGTLYSERWPWVDYIIFNEKKRICTTYILPGNIVCSDREEL